MNNTEKYINNHKRVFSLKNKRNKNHTKRPKSLAGSSIYALIKYHLKSIIRLIIYYPALWLREHVDESLPTSRPFFKSWKFEAIDIFS